jgi:hypothetical protein
MKILQLKYNIYNMASVFSSAVFNLWRRMYIKILIINIIIKITFLGEELSIKTLVP